MERRAPRKPSQQEILDELAKHLSPGNANVTAGDIIACIRDLAQARLTLKGLVEESERRQPCIAGRGEFFCVRGTLGCNQHPSEQ